MTKVLYKPFGILFGVLAGLVAGALYKRIWQLVAHGSDPPEAMDANRNWSEVVVAAAVEGAVFGGVKALVNRAGASGFEQVTGSWPGKSSAAGRSSQS